MTRASINLQPRKLKLNPKEIDVKLNELLEELSSIAFLKAMLPFHLRGWANALGLYVRERQAGNRVRLQAGGRFRSCLDAWKQGDGDWDVRKFDKDTWKKHYKHLVQPTEEIVGFLDDRVRHFDDLDSDGRETLINAIQHYKNTGNWLGLPEVPDKVRYERWLMLARDELHLLPQETLREAYEMLKQTGYKGEDLTKLELALKAFDEHKE